MYKILTVNGYNNIPTIVIMVDDESKELDHELTTNGKPTKITIRKGERVVLRQLKLFHRHNRISQASLNTLSYLTLNRDDLNNFHMKFSSTMLGLAMQPKL